MGGWFGVGGNGPDKKNESAAQSGLTSVFNYGLPAGKSQESTGKDTLDAAGKTLEPAADYWRRLLSGGRSDYEALAAPAINSTVDAADATRRQSAQFGSGRSGGDVALNRENDAETQKRIADEVNQNVATGRTAGAAGMEQVAGLRQGIGATQLQNALQLLGLGTTAESQVLDSSVKDRAGVRDAQANVWSNLIKAFL